MKGCIFKMINRFHNLQFKIKGSLQMVVTTSLILQTSKAESYTVKSVASTKNLTLAS